MLNKINEIISTVNSIACEVGSIQRYVGTTDEVDNSTLVGRIHILEQLVKENTWLSVEEWDGVQEWTTEHTNQITKEW